MNLRSAGGVPTLKIARARVRDDGRTIELNFTTSAGANFRFDLEPPDVAVELAHVLLTAWKTASGK
jgi:hypothetical protein